MQSFIICLNPTSSSSFVQPIQAAHIALIARCLVGLASYCKNGFISLIVVSLYLHDVLTDAAQQRLDNQKQELLTLIYLLLKRVRLKLHVELTVTTGAKVSNAQVVRLVAGPSTEKVAPHAVVVGGNHGAIADTAVDA